MFQVLESFGEGFPWERVAVFQSEVDAQRCALAHYEFQTDGTGDGCGCGDCLDEVRVTDWQAYTVRVGLWQVPEVRVWDCPVCETMADEWGADGCSCWWCPSCKATNPTTASRCACGQVKV